MAAAELFSPTEVGAAAGIPVKAVYKVIDQRLPRGLVVRRKHQRLLTRWGAVCVVLDRAMPRDVPVAIRRRVYAQLADRRPARAIECKRGLLSYVVNVRSAAEKLDADLARYRSAMKLIVEDTDVQGGAATFRGTRLLVHHIAILLERGASEAELREDYPRLTRDMIAAAPLYVRAHPRRGRPRKPYWRATKPLSERTVERRGV
jgi:uncharacterized protein (DUF433 family)